MMEKVSRTTPTTISKPADEIREAGAWPTVSAGHAQDVWQDGHHAQEQGSRQGDAPVHLSQIFLRGRTTHHAGNLAPCLFRLSP